MFATENKQSVSIYLKFINIYQWIFSIFGLTVPPPLLQGNLNRWIHSLLFLLYMGYCLLLIAMALNMALIHHVAIENVNRQYQLDATTRILSYSQNILLVAGQISMEFMALGNYKKLGRLHMMIKELEYNMKSLCNGNFRANPLKWKLLRISGLSWLILVGVMLNLNNTLTSEFANMEFRIAVLFFMAAVQVKFIEFGVYIQLVYEFLLHVHRQLVYLIAQIDKACQLQFTEENPSWPFVQKLMKIQMILNGIVLLVNKLLDYFSWPLLFVIIYNGEALLNVVNLAYLRDKRFNQNVYIHFLVLYILVLLSSLFVISCLTQRCIKKYNSIGLFIHTINLSSEDCGIIMRMREFSLQIMHQDLIFTCNGFLDIDFKSYGKMLLVISSYVVILIQFKMEIANETEIFTSQHVLNNY
uniref:Gustatory receptor n=1 Tax=Stomoxys calcitrans TaxID=35570 RepID=A0A1I8NR08_STOCA